MRDFGLFIVEQLLLQAEEKLHSCVAGLIFVSSDQNNSTLRAIGSGGYIPRLQRDYITFPWPDRHEFDTIHLGKLEEYFKRTGAKRWYLPTYSVYDPVVQQSLKSLKYLVVVTCVESIIDTHRLFSATFQGQHDVVTALLEKSVNRRIQNPAGQTALQIAAKTGHLWILRLLLGKFESDVSESDIDLNTALHVAIENDPANQRQTVALLREKGASLEIKNIKQESPLAIAVRKNLVNVLGLDWPSPLTIGTPKEVLVPRVPTPSRNQAALRACESYKATLAEFFKAESRSEFFYDRMSINELLYTEPEARAFLDAVKPLRYSDASKYQASLYVDSSPGKQRDLDGPAPYAAQIHQLLLERGSTS